MTAAEYAKEVEIIILSERAQMLKKRKRQVRDALNKCQSLEIIEKIAKLLNV